jgi:hypothetical protein
MLSTLIFLKKKIEDESLAELDNASSDLAQIPAITVARKSELKFFYLKTRFFTRKPNFQPLFFFTNENLLWP